MANIRCITCGQCDKLDKSHMGISGYTEGFYCPVTKRYQGAGTVACEQFKGIVRKGTFSRS